jgi:hypothetical protein
MSVTEIWKPVPVVGFSHLYEVSDHGRVRRSAEGVTTYVGRILKGATDKDGYYKVKLTNGPAQKLVSRHQLVALAFIANPDAKPEVNHKDCNKANNHVGNLEWVTTYENNEHYRRSGNVRLRGAGKKLRADLKGDGSQFPKMEAPRADTFSFFHVSPPF